jgi:hypothetical protein
MNVQTEEEPIKPIADADLPVKVREIFESLFDEIYELFSVNDGESVEEAGQVMCGRIQKDVSEYPILAKTVSDDMLGWSLLTVVCEKTYSRDVGHDAIKYLISMNPHALIWRWGDDSNPIKTIARNDCHCVLLPWIAEHHAWIFEHPEVRQRPPHFELVRNHANGVCSASVVRSFYEWYPQGLQQINEDGADETPLHLLLSGWEDCDAELFEWMAKQYPEAISICDNFGMTALHKACGALSSSVEEGVAAPSRCTENTARICSLLVSEYPQAIRIKGKGGRGIPIHYLARRCNRPLVQDLVILMLRHYPHAIDIEAAPYLPKLATVPFIQQIRPLVQQEMAIQEERAWLSKARTNFCVYTDSVATASFVKASEVFSSWATDRLAVKFPTIEEEIQQRIVSVKAELEGEDVDDSDEEDDESNDGDGLEYWGSEEGNIDYAWREET